MSDEITLSQAQNPSSNSLQLYELSLWASWFATIFGSFLRIDHFSRADKSSSFVQTFKVWAQAQAQGLFSIPNSFKLYFTNETNGYFKMFEIKSFFLSFCLFIGIKLSISSFLSILCLSNSEHWSQKTSQNGSIHSIYKMSMLQAWAF